MEQFKAGLEGAAQGAIGPLAPAAEIGLGITTPQAMSAREQEWPATHDIAKGAMFLGTALTGTGEAALVGKAGEAVASAAGLGGATGLGARIGAGALKGATELGLLSTGDEATKQIIQDPATASQAAMVSQPFSSILGNVAAGGVFGGAFGAASPLLAKWAPKIAQGIEDIKGTFAGNAASSMEERNALVVDELSTRYNQMLDAKSGTYGKDGLKMQAIRASVPENMTQGINDSTMALSNKVQALIDKNEGNPAINQLRQEHEDFLSKAMAPVQSDTDRFMAQNDAQLTGKPYTPPAPFSTVTDTGNVYEATNSLKQFIANEARIGDSLYGASSTEKAYVNSMRSLSSDFKNALEDSKVWGKAGDIQAQVNQATSQMIEPLKLFESAVTRPSTEAGSRVRVVDPGKVQTLINNVGKPSSATNIKNINAMLEGSENYFNQLNSAHSVVGDSLIEPSSLANANKYLGKYTTGMKIGDALLTKGPSALAKLVSGSIGATVGGISGGLLGGPAGAIGASGWGAYMGREAFAPMLEKILPAMGSSFFEKLGSAPGVRGVSQYVSKVAAGNEIISKGAKNLFKAGAEVLPLSAVPKLTSINKLNQRLVAAQNNPEQVTQNMTNDNLGTYMPNHASAMAQTIGSGVQYLNAQRPQTSPQAPLDNPRTPSSVRNGAYQNALTIAEQPAMVMHQIKAGTITPDSIAHLNALFPALYPHMQSQISQAMAEHIAKGGTVPYQTRVGLSIFMQQPMDSTFMPANILAAQPQGGQPQAPRQGKKSSTKDIGKIAQAAQTPLQASQARQSKSE